jgi:hypothetical protein
MPGVLGCVDDLDAATCTDGESSVVC